MLVIPSIDLKQGLCVRLLQGRAEKTTIYDRNPIGVARSYVSEGAERIHVVDLDGAFSGVASQNRSIIRQITGEVNVPVEVGGGVRSIDDIKALLEEVGARYVVVGTLAIENPDALEAAIDLFGEAIIVGIDARDGSVATRGWTETTGVETLRFARKVASLGARRIIYTDIARDGGLSGPNIEMTREVALASGIPVTASGGVSSLEDIQQLTSLETHGVDSVIIGKALYEERFTLRDAIAQGRKSL